MVATTFKKFVTPQSLSIKDLYSLDWERAGGKGSVVFAVAAMKSHSKPGFYS